MNLPGNSCPLNSNLKSPNSRRERVGSESGERNQLASLFREQYETFKTLIDWFIKETWWKRHYVQVLWLINPGSRVWWVDYMEQSFWPGPRVWWINWYTDWLIDWLTDGLIDWLMDCLMDWLMDWLNLTWFQGVVIWLIVLLIDGLVVKLINWLIAWEFLTWFQGVVIWLIDWLVDWLIDGWMDWLMDWLRVSDLVPGCGEPQAVQPLLPQHKIVFNLKEDKCVRFCLFHSKKQNISCDLCYFPHCSCLTKRSKHLKVILNISILFSDWYHII